MDNKIDQRKKIVVKIGSNVLANSAGLPNISLLQHLTGQVSELKKAGFEVILVSSGAVAAGRSVLGLSKKLDTVAKRQILASVGQVKLMQVYAELFASLGLHCSQVLVTKEDFRDRVHYLNIKNCLSALLSQGVVPVVNENDVVSVTELMFTDNDELAGLVAAMMNVDALFILSNVEGVYDRDPSDPAATVIPRIEKEGMDFSKFVVTKKSDFGRGGMITKCKNAQKVASLGIAVHIANGLRENILVDLVGGNPPGTLFSPYKSTSNLKKWIAQSSSYVKGRVFINDGAKKALVSEIATSLLPVGITKIEGVFEKGDVVQITDETGKELGIGMAQYSSHKAFDRIGKQNQKPLVHYDFLYLHD